MLQVHTNGTTAKASTPTKLTMPERHFVHTACRRMFQEVGASHGHMIDLVMIAATQYEGTKPAKKRAKAQAHKAESADRKRATKRAREHVAAGIFMTRLAGKRLANIRWRDLDGIASKSHFEMRFAALLQSHRKPDNLDARLPEIYSAVEVAAMLRKAKAS